MAARSPDPLHKPRERHYAERDPNRGRDVDAAERINRLRAIMWSAYVLLFAVPIGLFTLGFPWGLLAGLVAAGSVYAGTMLVTQGGARMIGTIHNPQGRVAPERRDYSFAQSLAARGDFAGAVREYERAVIEFPQDPEPYIRIARLKRRELQQPEDAVNWFKRARTDAEVSLGQELLVTRELIELYRGDLNTPERAIPELARLIDRFPDDPAVDVSKRELAELRERLSGS